MSTNSSSSTDSLFIPWETDILTPFSSQDPTQPEAIPPSTCLPVKRRMLVVEDDSPSSSEEAWEEESEAFDRSADEPSNEADSWNADDRPVFEYMHEREQSEEDERESGSESDDLSSPYLQEKADRRSVFQSFFRFTCLSRFDVF